MAMAIHILEEPDIYISKSQYERYKQEWEKAYRMYVGSIPTLEEFIRNRQREERNRQREENVIGIRKSLAIIQKHMDSYRL